jgi:hypothetical protein
MYQGSSIRNNMGVPRPGFAAPQMQTRGPSNVVTFDDAMNTLQAMFSEIDKETLAVLLENNNFHLESTIEQCLIMGGGTSEDASATINQAYDANLMIYTFLLIIMNGNNKLGLILLIMYTMMRRKKKLNTLSRVLTGIVGLEGKNAAYQTTFLG